MGFLFNRKRLPQKIFGIGFHKTGTSTLGEALHLLGYKVCDVRKKLVKTLFIGDLKPVFKIVDNYDAFEDNPWPLLFKELDAHYPNSKFILTLREPQSWLKSVVNHFGKDQTEMRKWIYGVGFPLGNERIYLQRYQQHNAGVLEYFKERPKDLLVLDWAKGEGWEKLCKFLNFPIPDLPFPHANRGNYSYKQ